MASGNKKCGQCSEDLPTEGTVAICRLCGKGFHLNTCSVKVKTWNSYGKQQQDDWKCQNCKTSVKTGYNKGDETPSDEGTTTGSLCEILQKLNSLLAIKDQVSSIDQSMVALNGKYEDILKEVKSLREENQKLRDQQSALNKRQVKLEEGNTALSGRLLELEQYGRRINLEIHGLEVKPNQSGGKEEVSVLLQDISSKIGVDYKPEFIQKAHRLQPRQGNKPPTLLIQFTSSEVRDKWLRAGKKAKLVESNSNRKIFFNENLTHYYRSLLGETKKCAAAHGYSFVWVQGGKILVRKKDSDRSVIVVKHFSDLRKIGLRANGAA